MPTTVQLRLSVDESGAITGLRSFDREILRTKASVAQLEAAGNQASRALRIFGANGEVVWQQASAGVEKVGKHAINSHDKLRILENSLGLEIPRSMGKVILQSELATRAIGAMSSVMIGLGGLEIFAAIGKEAYEFYEKMTDVNEAMREFTLEAAKSAKQELFSTASIETVNSLLQKTEGNIKTIEEKRSSAGVDKAGNGGIAQYFKRGMAILGSMYASDKDRSEALSSTPIYNKDDDKNLAEESKNNEYFKNRKTHLDQISKLDRDEADVQLSIARATAEGRVEAGLRGAIKLAGIHREQKVELSNLHAETVNEARKQQKEQHPEMKENDPTRIQPVVVDKNEGQQEYNDAVYKAQQEAAGKRAELSHTINETRIRLENETHNALLRGEALYYAQSQQQMAEYRRNMGGSAEALAREVDAKYKAEHQRRIDDMSLTLDKEQANNDAIGKTGLPQLEARHQATMKSMRATDYPSAQLFDRAKAQEEKRYQIETAAAQKSFDQQTTQADNARTAEQLSGLDRIRFETRSAIEELDRLWMEHYGRSGDNDQRYQAMRANIARQGARQESEAAFSVQQETERMEREAYRRSLSPMHAQTQQIYDEYADRKAELDHALTTQKVSWEEYNRKVVALDRIKNADLMAQQRELRDRLAGELQSFFSNPAEFMKHKGEELAAKSAATMLMKLGSKAGVVPDGSTGDDLFSFKLPGRGKKNSQEHLETMGRTAAAVQSGFITLTSATINITGQAMFSGASAGTSPALASSAMGLNAGAQPSSSDAPEEPSSVGSFDTNGNIQPATTSTSGASSAGASSSTAGTVLQRARNISGLAQSFRGSGVNNVRFSETQHQSIEGQFDAAGNFVSGKSGRFGNGMRTSGGFKSNAMGAAGGAMGLYGAYEGNGGFSGAASGALSGMQMGAALGGPIGAGIGAAAGAVLGFVGFGGREKARVYWLKNGRPRLKSDTQSYELGGDYLTALSDIESLKSEAQKTTNSMGPAAKAYYGDSIKPEITREENNISRMQRSGRSKFKKSDAQYDIGADRIPRDGYAFIHQNERIMPSDQNERITRAVEYMSSPSAVASAYRSTMSNSSSNSAVTHNWDVDVNLSAIDAHSGAQFLRNNKHVLRSVLNESLSENSGGADA